MNDDRCVAITNAGARCKKVGALSDDGLCIFHDPKRKPTADEMRRRSGSTRSKVRRPRVIKTLQDAQALRNWILNELADAKIDTDKAKVMLSAIDSQEKALVSSELSELKAIAKKLAPGSA